MDTRRFDGIAKALAVGTGRRRLLAGIAAGLVGGVVSRSRARPAAAMRRAFCIPIFCDPSCCVHWCHCDCPCPEPEVFGIAGAGAVQLATGVSHFTLFASILSDLNLSEQSATDMAVARLQWDDPDAALTIESFSTDFYGPLEGVEGGREVIGWARVNGEGQYPYLLHAVAAEPRGAGPESVKLLVGDAVLDDAAATAAGLAATGFSYSADGELVGGDLQLLTFNAGQQSQQETSPATPAA